MNWIIFSIISLISGFIGFGFLNKKEIISTRYGEKITETRYSWGKNKFQLFSILALLFIIPAFFTAVPANSVGIMYSPFTGVSETTLSEGLHSKNPLSKVYKISTEIQTKTLENMYTQTSDSQYITSIIDIKYAVNKDNAFVVFKQFRTLDKMSEVLITPTVQRVLEKVTTNYNVIDILGERRNDMYKDLEFALSEEFSKSGITFYSVTINDTDAGDAIEKAIEQEAVAKKAVETAEQELLKVQTEAKQKTVQAEADKAATSVQNEVMIIKANADKEAAIIKASADKEMATIKAETKVIEAQAEKESNELLSKSISDSLLTKMYIEKWKGEVPTISGSDSSFMFDINSFLNK